jgi:DNA modification methylase
MDSGKTQNFMRKVVRASLPFAEGTVLDPFMGSGSTIAAAEAIGYHSLGIEIDKDYLHLADAAIP